jgi:hypothetical protein
MNTECWAVSWPLPGQEESREEPPLRKVETEKGLPALSFVAKVLGTVGLA